MNYAVLLRKVHRKKEAIEVEARAKQALAAQGQNYSAATLVDWHELQRQEGQAAGGDKGRVDILQNIW